MRFWSPADMVKKFHSDLALRLGRNIAAFRSRAALKQEGLAELIEVEISTVSRYETGTTLPSLVTLENLAKVMHCTASDLLAEKLPAKSPEGICIEAMIAPLTLQDRKMVMETIKTLVGCLHQRKARIPRKR
jgi:transcriptional regulator with XRE-family HTH domain